ncbi:UDP-phosphate galactose phosphotransferase, partial [Escherichia coli]|nr:UDP-phosphate galactose phosphotransferase [Escherichia coli]
MTLLVRNIIVSIALAMSDFFSFVISLYIAIGVLSISISDYQTVISANQLEGWKVLHWLLALCCVAWYSMRLRHYFYRKTFWFELKEILRTLVIFAVIEIAILAFANWSFSRFLWGLTWAFVLLFLPLARMATKRVLDVFGLWHRETWIIGSGANAQEAYKAINSERNLGLVIVGFIATTGEFSENKNIDDNQAGSFASTGTPSMFLFS